MPKLSTNKIFNQRLLHGSAKGLCPLPDILVCIKIIFKSVKKKKTEFCK